MSNKYSNQYDRLLKCIKDNDSEEEFEFSYRIDNRGVIIEKYLGDQADLIIPSIINGYPVYKIGENAFYEDQQIEKVTLPDTVRIIGKGAFAGSSLEEIFLPDSLLIIENEAFSGSPLLSVDIPNSVCKIGESAFEGTYICEIRIPDNVKVISDFMCHECGSLQTVIIDGATTIGTAAFEYCWELKNVYLPDTLTTIEDAALDRISIEYLIIPQSVRHIGKYNFPENAHIAILSDDTDICLDVDDCDYSTVTLYCNQSNVNARRVAKEYGMIRKTLSDFAKESAGYYKSFENLKRNSSECETMNKPVEQK